MNESFDSMDSGVVESGIDMADFDVTVSIKIEIFMNYHFGFVVFRLNNAMAVLCNYCCYL